MTHRVVVTGYGAIAPNGLGADAFWEATCAGRSGIRRIEGFDVTGFPVQSAGEAPIVSLSKSCFSRVEPEAAG